MKQTKRETLDLILTYHWYDKILHDNKREEYRDDTEYYRKRLTLLDKPILFSHRNGYSKIPYKQYKYVRFHRGYTSTTMTWKINKIKFGLGKKEWGAPDKPCHIICFSELQDYPLAY